MLRKFWAFWICIALFAPVFTWGQARVVEKKDSQEVPPVVIDALQSLKEKGLEAAMQIMFEGSPLEGDKDAMSEAFQMRRIQRTLGEYKGFDLLGTRVLSPRGRILFVALNYEKGILFGSFTVYRAEHGWILSSFHFDTAHEKILPEELMPVSRSGNR